MQYITFDLASMHQHGGAFFDYLKLRKSFFVDELNWPIAHNDNVEMDEYDNPLTHYALVMRDGEVVGGARCMSTLSQWGQRTFMVADAQKGMMQDIPHAVMPKVQCSPLVWETSRLVISSAITDRQERLDCLEAIINGMVSILHSNGATNLIALSSVAMLRTLRQIGFDVCRMGENYRDSDDGRLYCVMQMNAAQEGMLMAAE